MKPNVRGAVSRRTVLAAAAALGAAAGDLARPEVAPPASKPTAGRALPIVDQSLTLVDDPRASADGQVKLTATLDGSPAFWVYSGILYGVLPREKPAPILAISGCQANWTQRRGDGSYVMAAALLSYFLDVETRDVLDEFDNPLTKRRNPVRPNFFPAARHAVFPADGSALRVAGPLPASASTAAAR